MENASAQRLSEGPCHVKPYRVGWSHTGCGPGDEDGSLELECGGVHRFNGTPPVAGHYGDGLLRDLLPADSQLSLFRSLHFNSH